MRDSETRIFSQAEVHDYLCVENEPGERAKVLWSGEQERLSMTVLGAQIFKLLQRSLLGLYYEHVDLF